jgi:tetratricopeptide (TPR) repeat protein
MASGKRQLPGTATLPRTDVRRSPGLRFPPRKHMPGAPAESRTGMRSERRKPRIFLPSDRCHISLFTSSREFSGMSFLSQLANLFTRAGRDDNRLRLGMDHAHANRPEKAIDVYDSLLNCKTTSPTVRARALFNRALAYSSLKDDTKAIADLEQVLAMPAAPENVVTAARNQLIRVRNRIERVKSRPQR